MILQHDVLSGNYIKGPASSDDRLGWEIKQPAVLRCSELSSALKWEHPCTVDLLEDYKGMFKLHVCGCYQSQPFFCVKFAWGLWQSSEVAQTQGSAGIRTWDLPVLHHRNMMFVWCCLNNHHYKAWLTSAARSHTHVQGLQPDVHGRWDRVKNRLLILMFPLDIYSTYRKRPSFVITSLSITAAKSYLNGDGGC